MPKPWAVVGKRWLALAGARVHLVALWKLLRHPRTRWPAKAVALLALVYVLSPIDLVPDTIPLLGQLDDLTVLSLAMMLAVRLAPRALWEACLAEARTVKLPRLVWLALALALLWLLLAGLTGWWLWQAVQRAL